MVAKLSEEQRQALDQDPGKPVYVVDAATQSHYVLIPAEVFQRIQALLGDEEFEPREAYPLMDEVARKEGWNDPEMDAYDALDTRRKS